jgi:uncharacterized protein YkwD
MPTRALVLSLGVLLAACSSSRGVLPSGDGAGPIGSDGPGSPPSSPTSTPTAPPTSSPPAPTSSPPWATPDAAAPPWDGGAGAWTPDAGVAIEAGAAADSGGWGTDSGPGWPTTDAGTTSGLLALCVSSINQVRSQHGAPPYQESPDLETYAAMNAAADAQSLVFFGYFNQTGGGGVASTENEYDGGQIDPGGSAQQVMQIGLVDDQDGFTGGIGNLLSNQYSQVGCGFATDVAGNWWVAIEFQ